MIKKIYRIIIPEKYRIKVKTIQEFSAYQKLRKQEGHTYNCFDKTKSIFIHIPKAGGISTIKSLYGDQADSFGHPTYERFLKLYGKKNFDSYFKFTFVRNPWDRLFSAYNFLKKGGLNHLDKAFAEEVLIDYPTFESFVMNWCNEESINTWVHLVPQHKYLYKDETLMVDFVGRFENFNDDFEKVRDKINSGESLKHLNETSKKKVLKYKEVYTDEMISKVAKLYKKDIELFSYEF